MNLQHLKYFDVLAREQHYTRSSKLLNVTQPSLSNAIASLEDELGITLFEKKGRNVVLTKTREDLSGLRHTDSGNLR